MSTLDDQFLTPTTENRPSLATLGGALVLPSLILIARAVWRYVAEADELQSRKIVESLAIAFAGGSILTFTWGMLEHVGAPTLPIIWAMPVYMGCWLVASLIVNRRY